MHFSIPDTQEFIDNTGAAYTGYNIHINGLFHCTVRYKQLLNFHEQLTKEFDVKLPNFPSKKLFPLTNNQQEERRTCLEKYIQTIGQNSLINNCELLNGFLINAQQETSNKISSIQDINIYMFKNNIITLKSSTSESTLCVLKKALRTINLNNNYDYLFALYIVSDNINNKKTAIIRKLQNFESPILTMNNINIKNSKIVIGKNYWDVNNDDKLMNDPVSLDLLYIQTIAEIERGWIKVPHDYTEHLDDLKIDNNKMEYLNVVRNFKYYGYIQFSACYCDYPRPGTKVLIAIGKNELSIRTIDDEDDEEDDVEEHETIFKVTRMRCWRITTLHNNTDKDDDDDTLKYSLELSFEYLVAKNQLQWVSISSEQAILMSVSLQGMIDELLMKKTDDVHQKSSKTWTYIMRDGQKKKIIKSSTVFDDDINNEDDKTSEFIDKKINKNVGVPLKVDKGKNNDCDIMENNAFYMIGDDDL